MLNLLLLPPLRQAPVTCCHSCCHLVSTLFLLFVIKPNIITNAVKIITCITNDLFAMPILCEIGIVRKSRIVISPRGAIKRIGFIDCLNNFRNNSRIKKIATVILNAHPIVSKFINSDTCIR